MVAIWERKNHDGRGAVAMTPCLRQSYRLLARTFVSFQFLIYYIARRDTVPAKLRKIKSNKLSTRREMVS